MIESWYWHVLYLFVLQLYIKSSGNRARTLFSKLVILRQFTYPGERRTEGNGRDATENTRKLEAVFRSGISRIFSGGFQQLPVLSGRIRPEIIGKKYGKFQAGILLPCSRYFPCFPAGSGDFPASFLKDPARSGGRNDQPGYV